MVSKKNFFLIKNFCVEINIFSVEIEKKNFRVETQEFSFSCFNRGISEFLRIHLYIKFLSLNFNLKTEKVIKIFRKSGLTSKKLSWAM